MRKTKNAGTSKKRRVSSARHASGRGRKPESWKTKTRPWKAENYIRTPEDAVEYLRAAIATKDMDLISRAIGDIARTNLIRPPESRILKVANEMAFDLLKARVMDRATVTKRGRTYQVIWIDAYEEYVGLCDEHTGLSWVSKNPEDALKGIEELVAEVDADKQSESGNEAAARLGALARRRRKRSLGARIRPKTR